MVSRWLILPAIDLFLIPFGLHVGNMLLFAATSLHSCESPLYGILMPEERSFWTFSIFIFTAAKCPLCGEDDMALISLLSFCLTCLLFFFGAPFSCFPHRLCPARKGREHILHPPFVYIYI